MGSSKNQDSDAPNLDALIPLQEAAELSGLTTSRLRQLLRAGELWGFKPGRNWYTTEQAVKEYLARDIRPGPKPTTKAD